jgi:hypothetical protein
LLAEEISHAYEIKCIYEQQKRKGSFSPMARKGGEKKVEW